MSSSCAMPRIAVLLGAFLASWASAAPVEVATDQSSWRVAPGEAVEIRARLENRGPTAVYVNGISWSVSPEHGWSIDTGPFLAAAPAVLQPFESWEGVLAQVNIAPTATAGVGSIEIDVLGGDAEDQGDALCATTSTVSVNLPGCAPAVTTAPQDVTATEGDAAAFTVTAAGGAGTTFQWRKDGVSLADGGNLAGTQTSTLHLVACAAGDAGFYTVQLVNSCGELESTPARLTVQAVTGAGVTLPRRLAIEGVAPNPAGASSVVLWALPAPALARLEVYDVSGRRRRLLVNAFSPAGHHRMQWDGTDDRASRLPAGIYVVRLSAMGTVVSRKVALIR